MEESQLSKRLFECSVLSTGGLACVKRGMVRQISDEKRETGTKKERLQ